MSDAYGILSTTQEAEFDGIVLLTRTLCAAPAAQINFVTWSASGSRQAQGSARRGRRWGSRSPKTTNQLTVSNIGWAQRPCCELLQKAGHDAGVA